MWLNVPCSNDTLPLGASPLLEFAVPFTSFRRFLVWIVIIVDGEPEIVRKEMCTIDFGGGESLTRMLSVCLFISSDLAEQKRGNT